MSTASTVAALSPPGDIYVGFDVEASGMYMAAYDGDADFGTGSIQANAMVELGAWAARSYDRDRKELARFCEMMAIPPGCGWEPRCKEEFWMVAEGMPEKMRKIDECKQLARTVMCAFIVWVTGVVELYADGDSKRICFVTNAAAFDAAWVSLYLARYAGHQPLHTFFGGYRGVLDTSSYAMGVTRHTPAHKKRFVERTGAEWYRSKDAARAVLGVPDSEKPHAVHDHSPVNDAQYLVEEHMILEQYLPACTD